MQLAAYPRAQLPVPDHHLTRLTEFLRIAQNLWSSRNVYNVKNQLMVELGIPMDQATC